MRVFTVRVTTTHVGCEALHFAFRTDSEANQFLTEIMEKPQVIAAKLLRGTGTHPSVSDALTSFDIIMTN